MSVVLVCNDTVQDGEFIIVSSPLPLSLESVGLCNDLCLSADLFDAVFSLFYFCQTF